MNLKLNCENPNISLFHEVSVKSEKKVMPIPESLQYCPLKCIIISAPRAWVKKHLAKKNRWI